MSRPRDVLLLHSQATRGSRRVGRRVVGPASQRGKVLLHRPLSHSLHHKALALLVLYRALRHGKAAPSSPPPAGTWLPALPSFRATSSSHHLRLSEGMPCLPSLLPSIQM